MPEELAGVQQGLAAIPASVWFASSRKIVSSCQFSPATNSTEWRISFQRRKIAGRIKRQPKAKIFFHLVGRFF
jgi:hypothetical protein